MEIFKIVQLNAIIKNMLHDLNDSNTKIKKGSPTSLVLNISTKIN
jgi:hypothetical protein